jgi:hypothetical protein
MVALCPTVVSGFAHERDPDRVGAVTATVKRDMHAALSALAVGRNVGPL